jgi:ABC-type phosphate transport system substrate-binding protein
MSLLRVLGDEHKMRCRSPMEQMVMIDETSARSAGWRLAGYLLVVFLPFFGVSSAASWAQAPQTRAPVSLHGAGSTFAAPLYTKWIEEYGRAS